MIRVVELRKSYQGKQVLGPVSFEVRRGETIGVLGRNGAGKTTMLRILAGDLRPSAGSVWIDDVDVVRDPLEARARIGYLPEVPPIYEDMRVGDFLEFAGRLRGVAADVLPERLREAERLTQIDHKHDQLIRTLSHGYRQRVGVAQAIIHEPPLLILDEPTHDLDPLQIVEMRNLIHALKGKHTVIISSHILPEIHETCDRLLVIAEGQIVASGSEAELTGRFLGVKSLRVTVRPAAADAREAGRLDPAASSVVAREGAGEPWEGLAACVRAVPGVSTVSLTDRADGVVTLTVSSDEDRRAQVCRALVLAGHDVLQLERAERELENEFLELVGEGSRARN